MRILPACILLLFVFSCGYKEKNTDEPSPSQEHQEIKAFQVLLDSAQLGGCILVFDPQRQLWHSNDFEYAQKGYLPASTFKIPHSLIALETGVVESDSTLFPWDGTARALNIWEQDLQFHEALRYSCVPCYQQVARKIGALRMRRFLDTLNYGQMVFDSTSVDKFWLTGSSKISPFQQLDFLHRFYANRLPVSSRSEQIVKDMLVLERDDNYTLSGKTGWSIRGERNQGWFVGQLQTKGKAYYVATHVEPKGSFDEAFFLKARKALSVQAFRELGLLP